MCYLEVPAWTFEAFHFMFSLSWSLILKPHVFSPRLPSHRLFITDAFFLAVLTVRPLQPDAHSDLVLLFRSSRGLRLILASLATFPLFCFPFLLVFSRFDGTSFSPVFDMVALLLSRDPFLGFCPDTHPLFQESAFLPQPSAPRPSVGLLLLPPPFWRS